MTVTENGFGKRSSIDDYRITNRGGKGIINIKTSERNGQVVAVKEVVEDDELMIITQNGIIIRTAIRAIRSLSRATQGVTLINLDEGDSVVDVARLVSDSGVSIELGEANGNSKQDEGAEEAPPEEDD